MERPSTMSPQPMNDETKIATDGSESGLAGDGPFAGYETEHIYIGDDSTDAGNEPEIVSRRTRIKNPARGITTELVFYREGFLRVIEGTGKRQNKDHTLELRFIDPEPEVNRRIVTGWAWSALGAAAAAIGAYFILPLTGLSDYTIAATTILMTLSAVTLLVFAYTSEERIQFFTASGRAEVVDLVSSVGCIRKVRRSSSRIQKSIAAAGGDKGIRDVRYLRAEMQEHYKLREAGVISEAACSDGTARILARFG